MRAWAIAAAPILLLGVVQGILLNATSPLGFQRAGAAAVAALLVFYGMSRRMIRRFSPSQKREVAASELAAGAVATLQWGYGDLFHCWAHGHGWKICY